MTQLPEKTDGPRLNSNKTWSGSQFGGLSWDFFSVSGKDVKSTQENSPQCILKVRPSIELQHGVDVPGTAARGPGDRVEGGQAGH